MTSTINERISELRKLIGEQSLQAIIIPTADPHLSEYVAPHYAGRAWLSGFTGSTGDLVVTLSGSALFTDSRYWVQAQRQLSGSEIELIKAQKSLAQCECEYLGQTLKSGDSVGICGQYVSSSVADYIESELTKHKIKLVLLKEDPLNEIWWDRPELTFNPIFEHKASPRSSSEKLELLKSILKDKGADRLLLTSLEDIAWLTNLRGSDLPCTPVFYSYGVFDIDNGLTVFIHEKALPIPVGLKLVLNNINFRNYHDFPDFIKDLAEKPGVIAYSPSSTNAFTIDQIAEKVTLTEVDNPVELLRAIKTPREIELISQAMEKDGIALCKFFCWLDKNKNSGELTELFCAEKLLEFRKQADDFISPSFETISAFGENAALPHYQPDPENPIKIAGSGFLLIDSGAQFPEGTTDITRTVLIGEASEQMKEDYTAVLRAHICLAKTVFPNLISSQAIDCIARAPIWQNGVEYGHGTGHGVGFFLNVHEGPQRISYPRLNDQSDVTIHKNTRMRAGMVTSDEPGIYREGKWGIRIENLLANIFDKKTEFGEFLRFEALTLCPIDLTPVIPERLQSEEKSWLNAYHKRVLDKLSPALQDDQETLEWLKEKTCPLE